MLAPLTVFYDVRLTPDPMGPMIDGIADYAELREPDEWGEPGPPAAQTMRCIRLKSGKTITPDYGSLVSEGFRYTIASIELHARPHWPSDD